jgi:hypothetical protein
MNQLALSLPDKLKYPDRFWYWLEDNRHVYREFERKALEMARRGRKHYSARTIIETLRWESDLRDTETTWKINDHFTPGLARFFMEEHGKRFPGFFELRE